MTEAQGEGLLERGMSKPLGRCLRGSDEELALPRQLLPDSPAETRLQGVWEFILIAAFAWLFLFAALVCSADASEPVEEGAYADVTACRNCHEPRYSTFDHGIHGTAGYFEPGFIGCESCHGPGAMHAASGGEKARIIGPSTWTQEQATGFCLACHVKTVKLRFWYGSAHQRAGLMCHDCHKVSFSRVENDRLVFKAATLMEACIRCHAEKRIALTQRSRHPLRDSTRPDFEGNMTCVDCHNPHGAIAAHLIDADSINDKCWQCHMEKRFPLQDGHPAAAEDCMDCHTPHGSNFPNLLRSGL